MHRTGRAVERRVTEREDPAVGRDQPVAVARRGRRDADDRAVQVHRTRRTVERRITEREDPTVGRDQPVAVTRRRRRDPDDRTIQMHRTGRAVERRVTEREDPAVGRDHPVAVARRRRRDADDRSVQVHRAGRAVERRVAAREDPAVRRHQPVAEALRRPRRTEPARPHDGVRRSTAADDGRANAAGVKPATTATTEMSTTSARRALQHKRSFWLSIVRRTRDAERKVPPEDLSEAERPCAPGV